MIIAVFVGACSSHSKPTAEIVLHAGMELQFLGVGDSVFASCRSVTQGKCIPPPPFPPLFSSSLRLCPLAAPALLRIRLFIFFTHLPLLSFLLPLCFFSLCFIFHYPIQCFSFRFINRTYTLLLHCLSYSLHYFLFFFPNQVSAVSYTQDLRKNSRLLSQICILAKL